MFWTMSRDCGTYNNTFHAVVWEWNCVPVAKPMVMAVMFYRSATLFLKCLSIRLRTRVGGPNIHQTDIIPRFVAVTTGSPILNRHITIVNHNHHNNHSLLTRRCWRNCRLKTTASQDTKQQCQENAFKRCGQGSGF
mgnify:FL=1